MSKNVSPFNTVLHYTFIGTKLNQTYNNQSYGRVAQLVERSLSMFPSMRKVLGSIPSSSTFFWNNFFYLSHWTSTTTVRKPHFTIRSTHSPKKAERFNLKLKTEDTQR